jgi:hypothetical protein
MKDKGSYKNYQRYKKLLLLPKKLIWLSYASPNWASPRQISPPLEAILLYEFEIASLRSLVTSTVL